jgi:hypothetical protein
MLFIEDNPRIDQKVFHALTKLGVTLVAQEDDARVVAQFPTPVHLDESGHIFKELNRLGVNGYDQQSLQLRTVEGVVNVSMALR